METRSWINECMIQLKNRHFRGYGVYGLQGSAKPSGNSHGHYQHNRCVVANILKRRTPSQNNTDPGCHRWCWGPSCCSHQVRFVVNRHPLFLVIVKFLRSFGGHSLSSRSRHGGHSMLQGGSLLAISSGTQLMVVPASGGPCGRIVRRYLDIQNVKKMQIYKSKKRREHSCCFVQPLLQHFLHCWWHYITTPFLRAQEGFYSGLRISLFTNLAIFLTSLKRGRGPNPW